MSSGESRFRQQHKLVHKLEVLRGLFFPPFFQADANAHPPPRAPVSAWIARPPAVAAPPARSSRAGQSRETQKGPPVFEWCVRIYPFPRPRKHTMRIHPLFLLAPAFTLALVLPT